MSSSTLFKVLAAVAEYTKNEIAKDPGWRPPDEMMPMLGRIVVFRGPAIDEHYKALQAARSEAVQPSSVGGDDLVKAYFHR
jgi:hypothetical protein